MRNFVVSGNFLSCKVKINKNIPYIQSVKKIYLSKDNVESIETIYSTEMPYNASKKIFSIFRQKSELKYSVIVNFRDSKKSLLEINYKIYNALTKIFS